ncbi:hypothetical protein [Flavobacterium sp.]|uniref:hypothetical protein n=1 Tax=Flavobacterium sp. TaxID=239 RepID=UPI0025C35C8C|nr:hypothetical protein [Flavobacterium sp.]
MSEAHFASFGSCAAACFDFDSSPASGAYFYFNDFYCFLKDSVNLVPRFASPQK